MSEITEKIQDYRAKKADWPATRDWLIAHNYVTPERYVDPQPGPTDERDWDFPYVDGSWDEVQQARGTLLTNDEYLQVVKGINARHKASHTP